MQGLKSDFPDKGTLVAVSPLGDHGPTKAEGGVQLLLQPWGHTTSAQREIFRWLLGSAASVPDWCLYLRGGKSPTVDNPAQIPLLKTIAKMLLGRPEHNPV